MKIRRDIVDYIYFAIFGIFIVLFLTGQFTSLTGTTLVVIDNTDPNSMFPTYFQGDLFIIHKDDPGDIVVGDVIVYKNTFGNRVIHRVIDVVETNAETYFRVKGDDPVTNPRPDPYGNGTLIPFEAVLGEVTVYLPYIGHLSLAMQTNPAVKVFVYMIAIGVAIVIIMWPEDEDEEEEKYYEVNKEALNELKGRVHAILKSIRRLFTVSRFKLLAWALLIILIASAFIPFFLPVFLPMSNGQEIGVTGVDIDENYRIDEKINAGDVRFYNITIYMFDDTSNFQHIDSYTLQVKTSSGEIVDESYWDTRRSIKGSFSVGGVITIDQDIYNQFSSGTELTVEIVIEIDEFLGSSTLDPYTQVFTVD